MNDENDKDAPIVHLEFNLGRIGLMACARYARLTGRPFNKTLAGQAAREALNMEAELARAKHEQRGQDVVYQPTTIEAFEADVLSNPDAESVN